MVKPLTFPHKNMFIVFSFNIQVETWYCNVKSDILCLIVGLHEGGSGERQAAQRAALEGC